MKVLFLHAASNEMLPEYKVQAGLAQYAPERSLDPYFIWQSSKVRQDIALSDRIILHDFGRDMSIEPKLGRFRRAARMAGMMPRSLLFLFETMRKLKPDIIYTSQRGIDVVLARMTAKIFGIPHVLHLHSNVGPWIEKPMLRLICGSEHIIAVSEFTRQTALLAGARPENVYTLINPVPPLPEMEAADPAAKRAEIGYPRDAPLVLCVGRLDPSKGHIALFHAFAQIVADIPSARLLVCGKSTLRYDYQAVLQQKLAELKLTEHVTLAGNRSDIRSLMRSADVFCLPTELDPCPLVFIEAAAEGLPSVAYYSGGVPELVIHDQTGLLSYPQDASALASNLRVLLENRDLAQKMGRAAKRRALETFDPRETARRWVSLLARFADEKVANTGLPVETSLLERAPQDASLGS
jgi:glycosyltransferase involved in cell wall biosynthesis